MIFPGTVPVISSDLLGTDPVISSGTDPRISAGTEIGAATGTGSRGRAVAGTTTSSGGRGATALAGSCSSSGLLGTDPVISAGTVFWGTVPVISGTGPVISTGTEIGAASGVGSRGWAVVGATTASGSRGATALPGSCSSSGFPGTVPVISAGTVFWGTGPVISSGTGPVISTGTEIGAATGVGSRGWVVVGATAASGGRGATALPGCSSSGLLGTVPVISSGTGPLISTGTEIGTATGVGLRGWAVADATTTSGGRGATALPGACSSSGFPETAPMISSGTAPMISSGTGPLISKIVPVISTGTEIGAATGVGSRGWVVASRPLDTGVSGGIVDVALPGATSGGETGTGAGTTIPRGIRSGRSASTEYASPPDIADSKRLMASSEGCRLNSPSSRKGVGKSSGARPDASGSVTRNGDAPPPKSNIIAPTVISPVSSP